MQPTTTAPENAVSDHPGPAVRERLLDVALQLFARKGFESTSVREIVAAAEVTKPALYYYFKNKEGLYLELVDRLYRVVENAVLHSVVEQGSAKSRVKSLILRLLNHVDADANNCSRVFVIVQNHRRDITFDFIRRITTLIMSYMTEIVTDGVKRDEISVTDVNATARGLFSCLLFFAYDNAFMKSERYSDEDIDAMIEKVFKQHHINKCE